MVDVKACQPQPATHGGVWLHEQLVGSDMREGFQAEKVGRRLPYPSYPVIGLIGSKTGFLKKSATWQQMDKQAI